MEWFCYFRNIQDTLADRKSPFETRFGSPCDCPVTPFGAVFFPKNPMSTKDRSRLHQFDSKMLPGIFIGLRSESWRKLDRRLDHRRLARHWEQRRVRSSRQKIQVQRKWHQCIAEAFVFPGADGSLRQEGHAQRQTSGHQRAESFDAGVKERVPSTLSEARRDPLQCAKDDSLQQEFAVAVFFLKLIATQRKRGNMSGVRLVNLFIATMSCPENGRMYRQSQHSQSRWKLTSWDKHKPIRTNLERAVTLKETAFSLKVGSDPRDSASWTSVHHKVYSWWMADRPKHKSHRDQKRFFLKCGHWCPSAFKRNRSSNGRKKTQDRSWTSDEENSRWRVWPHCSERLTEARDSNGTSNTVRYTSTHPNRQGTDAESCSVKRRQGATLNIERRATLSDEKRRATRRAWISEVHSSQRTRSFAWGSHCRSRISFVASLYARADQQSQEHSSSEDCKARKIGRNLVATILGKITQLGVSKLPQTKKSHSSYMHMSTQAKFLAEKPA